VTIIIGEATGKMNTRYNTLRSLKLLQGRSRILKRNGSANSSTRIRRNLAIHSLYISQDNIGHGNNSSSAQDTRQSSKAFLNMLKR